MTIDLPNLAINFILTLSISFCLRFSFNKKIQNIKSEVHTQIQTEVATLSVRISDISTKVQSMNANRSLVIGERSQVFFTNETAKDFLMHAKDNA